MIRALRIAWALVRVPNLTCQLFLLPIVLSLIVVIGQLVTTGIFLEAASRSAPLIGAEKVEAREKEADRSPIRYLLYGSGERRPELRVCRWGPNPDNPDQEVPPNAECKLDGLDVAIRVTNPEEFVADDYVSVFQGQIDRLHICKRCTPEAVISISDKGEKLTYSYSMWGVAVLSLAFLPSPDLRSEHRESVREKRGLIGNISLFLSETKRLVNLSISNPAVPFTINVVPLIIIALWLAIRAHGKVLDYFSQNNVLLPLVAATGKRAFYSALWMLTSARVGCFLAASIPLVYLGLENMSEDGLVPVILERWQILSAWFFAVVPAVGLSTVISSIADLKHRHSAVSFMYRYIPLILALAGGIAWSATFIFPYDWAGHIRTFITAIPVIGLAPLFIAPVTEPLILALLVHGALSLGTLLVLVRLNMRWFAAHLEEV